MNEHRDPRWKMPGRGAFAPVSGGLELDIDEFPKIYKGRGGLPDFLSRCAAHPTSSPLPQKLQAWCRYLLFLTTLLIIMFSKTALISLVLGVLYVNALSLPVAREPAPEPECEFPRLFPTIFYHGLTLVSFNSPRCRTFRPPALA